MSKKRKDLIYINGVCKSAENRLIGKDRLTAMAEAKSLADAFSVLSETGFGGENDVQAEQFETLIRKEEDLLAAFVREYAPNDKTEKFCLIPYDFFNAEVAVKCSFLNHDALGYMSVEGIYTHEQIKEFVLNDGAPCDTEQLKRAIALSNQSLKSGCGGMTVGNIFVKQKFDCLAELTKGTYLYDIVKKRADALNIFLALRSCDLQTAKEARINIGCVDDECLSALVSLKKDVIEKAFDGKAQSAKKLALDALSAKLKGEPFVDSEREYSDYGAARMIASRFTETDGTKPFMLYYYKRKNEIACVRTVLTGKANGLDEEKIKRRLLSV